MSVWPNSLLEHKHRQAATIGEAAMELIANKGMSNVTMSAVAKAAGVTRQTLYNYFPDVESIVVAVLEEQALAGEKELGEYPGQGITPGEKLVRLVRFVMESSGHGASAASLAAGLSPKGRARLDGHGGRVRQLIVAILREGAAEREFRSDLAPEMDGELLYHMITGAVACAGKRPDERDLIIKTTTATLLAAVKAAPR